MRSEDVRYDNAHRQVFTAKITFVGTPEQVFPLLCPVREYEWIPDWDCAMVYSASGVAELGCIFRTGATAEEQKWTANSQTGVGGELWTVTRYEPDRRISFVRNQPGIWVILMDITLSPEDNGTTTGTVSHTYTALSPEGVAQIQAITKEGHTAQWRELARLASHYIGTGTMATSG